METIKWSPQIAYAIGLIVTDGNLSPDRRHFDFTSKDIELIEAFKKCLSINKQNLFKIRRQVRQKILSHTIWQCSFL